MTETLSERYERDERRLSDQARAHLWSKPLVDDVVNVAAPILNDASWEGRPPEAAPGWPDRSTAALALAAIGLRTTRVIGLIVASGYSPEALPAVRRLFEAAGHAERVARDARGDYARNWLRGQGRPASNRRAYGGAPDDQVGWDLMSGQAHANFRGYASLLADLDDRNRVIHRVSPERDATWDNVWLWLTARQLGRILACVLKVHPQIDQSDYVRIMTAVARAEERVAAETSVALPPDDSEA